MVYIGNNEEIKHTNILHQGIISHHISFANKM